MRVGAAPVDEDEEGGGEGLGGEGLPLRQADVERGHNGGQGHPAGRPRRNAVQRHQDRRRTKQERLTCTTR